MSREDLQEILSALVPFARQQLEDLGYCPPCAASLDGNGSLDLHLPPVGENGSTEQILDLLRGALRRGARHGHYEAVGLCMEVQAERIGDPHPQDALCVHLEAPGECLQYFVPYRRTPDGDLTWGEAFFGPADAEIYGTNGKA